MRRTTGEKVFNVFNIILLSMLAFVSVYPIIYVLAASLSAEEFITAGKVWFLPKGFTWAAYEKNHGA